jgi:hypothetical protein
LRVERFPGFDIEIGQQLPHGAGERLLIGHRGAQIGKIGPDFLGDLGAPLFH